jgi:hypothetical protein
MDTVLGAGIPISIRSAELFGTFIENQRKKRVDTITSKRIVAVTPREGRRMERRLTWFGRSCSVWISMRVVSRHNYCASWMLDPGWIGAGIPGNAKSGPSGIQHPAGI